MSPCRIASIVRSGGICLGALLPLSVPCRAQLAFDNLAAATGTTAPSWGRGVGMVDLDGDGLLDLVLANDGMDNYFFRQRPDHTFEPANQLWGVASDSRATWGVLVADFDNDGDPDVYFINSWVQVGDESNQFLRNELDTLGVFTDVPAGDASFSEATFGGTAFDYDLDGDLDIFLTTTVNDSACILLENDGKGVFSDVSTAAGITHLGFFRHCTMGDIDNDGWFDIAAGGADRNRVYRNNGDGTFAEISDQLGLACLQCGAFGLVLDDFDNDGWLDAYVPRYQLTGVNGPSQLLLNDGAGAFVDVSVSSGMTGQADMGHSTADLDADGFPEIYVGTGGPAVLQPDVLLRVTPGGTGGLTVSDVSSSSGILSQGPTRCHGMGFGDYDQDGFVDIYVNNGGPGGTPQTLGENFLWKNQGNTNNWIGLHLTGVVSNRDAIGARATAIAETGKRVCRMRRAGHGFANSDSPILHFGMGATQAVDRIEIRWPSGIWQVVLAPESKQVTEVLETGMRLVGQPNVGSLVALEVAGPMGFASEFFLSTSTAPVNVPLPALGGILLMAPPVLWFASLPLDPSGVGSLPLSIPAVPSLAGAELRFQAWIHSPLGLTGSVLSGLVPLTIEP